jgi:hypothetical protein
VNNHYEKTNNHSVGGPRTVLIDLHVLAVTRFLSFILCWHLFRFFEGLACCLLAFSLFLLPAGFVRRRVRDAFIRQGGKRTAIWRGYMIKHVFNRFWSPSFLDPLRDAVQMMYLLSIILVEKRILLGFMLLGLGFDFFLNNLLSAVVIRSN